MTTGKTMSELEAYVDGECGPEVAAEFRAELEGAPELAREAGRLEALNEVLREPNAVLKAPEALRSAVEEKYGLFDRSQRLRSPGRRGFMLGAGGALAAGVAGIAVFAGLQSPAMRHETAVETFFHDFETYLAKDKSIDVTEGSMLQLASWFGSRLPFELPPIGSSGENASLVGGRLCWLLERRLASLSYEAPEGSMVLYVMKGDGVAIPAGQDDPALGSNVSWHRSAGNTSLVWRSGQLLYVFVSQLELHRLKSVARALVG